MQRNEAETPVPEQEPVRAGGNRRRPGRPRKSDAATDTRIEILEAALSLFARDGFEGATVSEIAKQAGVTQPLVHYHFRSKDILWRNAVAHGFRELPDITPGPLVDAEPQEGLDHARELIQRFVRFCSQRPEVVRIILHEGARPTWRLDFLLDKHLAPRAQGLVEIIEASNRRGFIRDYPVASLMTIIFGSAALFSSGAPMIKSLYGVDATDPAEWERHTTVLTEVLLSGLLNDRI